jgi:DNA repair photolyase
MRQDWGNWVIIKQNAAEILDRELANWYKKNPGRPPRIYMSSVTDPYQPIESKEQLTRSLLGVLLESDYPSVLVIQTRSPMIIRDIDFLQRFKQLRVNMSIPTGSERVRKDFEPRSPSIKARLNAITRIKQAIDPWKGYIPKISITITPLLPTLPDDQITFINKLKIADRVVIQDFHPSNRQSLIASTRADALALKRKYAWWYDNEEENYQRFKETLAFLLPNVQIMEGKEGFGYE